jgi:hypothetical protein
MREVLQETGIGIQVAGVAFVLDATSPSGDQHLFEIVFASDELDVSASPRSGEDALMPSFVGLDVLSELPLLPHISGRLRSFGASWLTAEAKPPVALYLGNVWAPHPSQV